MVSNELEMARKEEGRGAGLSGEITDEWLKKEKEGRPNSLYFSSISFGCLFSVVERI